MKNIQLPGSKSISNRVLLLSALSDKPVILENLLESDDTRYMREALGAFGVVFEDLGSGRLKVEGKDFRLSNVECRMNEGTIKAKSKQRIANSDLYIGNAGTAARFLSCVSLLLSEGEGFALTGNEYMQKRPQKDLFEALRSVGVQVACLGDEGYLPVKFSRSTLALEGRPLKISGKVSSQFLSGLLLVAPRMKNGLTIEVVDDIPSWPYVAMTIEILKTWGVLVEVSADRKKFEIAPGIKAPEKYIVPSDMSAASYPLAWSVLKKEKICITNFGSETLQGDEGFLEIIEKVGGRIRRSGEKCYVDPPEKLLPIGDFNWEKMPDVSMTGMILAACAEGESYFTGLESLRVKECDRIVAMAQINKLRMTNDQPSLKLRRAGELRMEVKGDKVKIMGSGELQITNDELRMKKAVNRKLLTVNSYDDHRIAMCFGVLKSVLGFGSDPFQLSNVKISEPECVAKTWPNFWLNLADWEGELRAVSGVILKKVDSGECVVNSEDQKQTNHSSLTTNHLYLIVKKPRKENAWQFPQGGVDAGESDLQAAKRELLEECGEGLRVKFKGERPVGSYQYFFPKDFKRHDVGIIGAKVQFFVAEYLGGDVVVDGEEIVDYKWVSKGELKDYFEGKYLEVIKEFL